MELIHQVRSILGRKMIQRSKGRKSSLKHSQVGLMGEGVLKENTKFMVKRQKILFYTHNIIKQLY